VTEQEGKEGLVLVDWKDLSEEISKIGGAGDPIYNEHTLGDTILYPIKTHVYGLRTFWFYCFIGYPYSTLIVHPDGGGGLGVAEVGQSLTKFYTYLSSSKSGRIPSFSYGGNYDGDEGTEFVEGGVGGSGSVGGTRGSGGDGAEEEDPSSNTAGVGTGEVRGVRGDREGHVGGADFEVVGGMGGGIAEEAFGSGDGFEGGGGLFRGDGGDSGEERTVKGTAVKKVGSNDLLDLKFLSRGGWGGGVLGSKLGGLTAKVGGSVDCGGGEVANAGGAALGKEVGDVVRHGEGQEPGCTIVIGRVAQVFVLGTSTVSF